MPPAPPQGGSAAAEERAELLASAARRRKRQLAAALAGLTLLLLAVSMLAVSTGAVGIGPGQMLAILAAQLGLDLPWTFTSQQETVLFSVRLPRVVLGALVGGALAVSGGLMQGLFRNPLAAPGLIGVSAGAAFFAVAMLVLGATLLAPVLAFFGSFAVATAAFIGGTATTFLVYRLATHEGHTSVATMLLAGIAINALAGAGNGLMIFLADDGQLRDVMFWMLGSLSRATWTTVGAAAPFMLLAIVVAPLLARPLNAMLLGEAEAGHLGINTQRLKRWVIVLAALAVGAAVAVSGIIGFVGLVVPHLLRLAFGPDHRLLLPGSVLLGAALLVVADLLARALVAPAELPIGILTALVGGPFFLWLLLQRRSRAMLSI